MEVMADHQQQHERVTAVPYSNGAVSSNRHPCMGSRGPMQQDCSKDWSIITMHAVRPCVECFGDDCLIGVHVLGEPFSVY